MDKQQPDIIDYEGSSYRTDFWEGKGRDYEDGAERVALNRMLPFNGGRRLLEIGAGFGRLTNIYHAYQQVVLLDYSFSQLQYAREQHGALQRFVYVAADAYNLPFRPGVFDGLTMIRTIHHFRDVPLVLRGIRRVSAPGGVLILEHANKRNLKAMLRYALDLQEWSPYTLTPHEFVDLNIDFHPTYMQNMVRASSFEVVKRFPVSYFRLGLIKRALPTDALVWLDGALQHSTLFYAPSVFIKAIATGPTPDHTAVPLHTPDALFAAPGTGNPLQREGATLVDTVTGQRWAIRDGIYDFKTPLGD
jgi:SAM-dependent methyltransferase